MIFPQDFTTEHYQSLDEATVSYARLLEKVSGPEQIPTFSDDSHVIHLEQTKGYL